MLWTKILHHRLICSFAVFSFFSLFWLFGSSSSAYATSVTCNYSLSNGNTVFSFEYTTSSISFNSAWTSDCDTSNLSFVPLYFQLDSFDFTFVSNISQIRSRFNNPVSFMISGLNTNHFTSNDISTPIPVLQLFYSNGSSLLAYDNARYQINSGNVNISDGTATVTYSDTLGGGSTPCPEPPEPDCPDPIDPDAPYSGKLDDIKRAIYVCGAILLVLYFFFCIFKIIVKDGGSRS